MSDAVDRQINFTQREEAGRERLGALLIVLAVAAVLMRTSWIGDDALISMQQVRLFVAGDGIVWNPGIRVQAFTHPAWFGVLSGLHAVTGAMFFPAILASIALTAGAVLVLWYFVREHLVFGAGWAAMLVLSVLLSRGFVDFGTSGLEVPLSFALSAAVMWLLVFGRTGVWLWLALALLVLNRMDHAVLLGPLALGLLGRALAERRILVIVPGALVLLAWFAFATFYFGSPLPNTYFAKVGGQISLDDRLAKGVYYLTDAFLRDGYSLGVVLLGIVAGLSRGGSFRLIALGLVLHLLYLIWVGGDFMRGRFLAVPFFVSLFLIATAITPRRAQAWAVGLIGLAIILGQPPSLDRLYSQQELVGGIADERGFYFREFATLSPIRAWPEPAEGRFDRPSADLVFVGCGGIGYSRYTAPPRAHLIDTCALTDPFLARLPVPSDIPQRIGHASRRMPVNYAAAVKGSATPTAGAALYDEMMLISAGPLWSRERHWAILRRLFRMGEEPPAVFRNGGSPDVIFMHSDTAKSWYEAIAATRNPPPEEVPE
ncbi:MAG: hypothetical protein AAFR17_02925 [Pseudomonadota bacterium]